MAATSQRGLGLAAASLLLFVAGCTRTAPAPPAAKNLVIVTIDTLRADRLGCYGASVATPNIDAMAAAGALATNASAHVPLTRPSHTSLFTGLYPAEHGQRDNVTPGLVAAVPTLADTLAQAGFRTAAFVSSVVLSRQSGLARGFATYSDRFEIGEDDARFLNTIQKRGDGPTAEAIDWLQQNAAQGRFFLWLHLYDPHDPYEPPEPYASRYPGRPYDGEVAWSDELVGRLDAALKRLGVADSTALVVTSDHGEGLGEHGESVHGFFVYQSTLHVPLVIRAPGVVPGRRFDAPARTVDIFPTALELLGMAQPPGLKLSGRSLAPALRGGAVAGSEPIYAESLVPLLHFGWSDLRTLRDGRYKYIQAPRAELYDLKDDPGELQNLAASQPAKAAALRGALAQWLTAEKARAKDSGAAAAIPPEMLEKLGALGYIGAGTVPAGAATGADPKDKVEDYKLVNRLMREGLVALREQRPQDSVVRFAELQKRGIESFELHYYLARALAQTRHYHDAAAHYEKALERLPGYGAAYVGIADARLEMGDSAGALAALERGVKAAPTDSQLPLAQARIFRRLERPQDAVRAYEAAVALAPKNALAKVQLGEMYRDANRPGDAIRLLREAVALDGTQASYWNSLGMVLGGQGQMAEAEKVFREAVKLDGKDPLYNYNLGLTLLRQSRPADAEPWFRKTLALQPSFTAARERLREIGSR